MAGRGLFDCARSLVAEGTEQPAELIGRQLDYPAVSMDVVGE